MILTLQDERILLSMRNNFNYFTSTFSVSKIIENANTYSCFSNLFNKYKVNMENGLSVDVITHRGMLRNISVTAQGHHWLTLLPICQGAITWNSANMLSIGPLGTTFNEFEPQITFFCHENAVGNVVCKASANLCRSQLHTICSASSIYDAMIYETTNVL